MKAVVAGPAALAFGGLLAVPLLLPFGRAAEAGVALCLVATGWALWRRELDWRAPAARLFLLGWGAYLLAALLALPDAVDPGRSLSTVLAALRYGALGGAALLLDSSQRRRLLAGSALVLLAWTLDALLQAASGWSLGGARAEDRLSGIFGADNLKLGIVLAALAPLLLAQADAMADQPGRVRPLLRWLALGLLGAVVLLAGARAGWVMFAVVAAWWLWRWTRTRGWRRGPVLAAAAAGATALGLLLYAAVPQFAERVDRTLLLASGERSGVDAALAFRLPIWTVAVQMAADHPLNGVGVRGFRHAYLDYAGAADRHVLMGDGRTGATHPHQLLLELLCETGAIGLLLWLAASAVLLRAWWRADAATRTAAWPWAAALLAITFPLNTHLAFYSSFWGLVLFWLLGLYCAALRGVLVVSRQFLVVGKAQGETAGDDSPDRGQPPALDLRTRLDAESAPATPNCSRPTTNNQQLLSAVVTTFDNAATLGRCLDSLRFADELVVLDSFSRDDTLAIATAAGARVLQQAFKGYGPQKADAIALARHPWVLLLDADEWLPRRAQLAVREWLDSPAAEHALGARLPRIERLFWRYPHRGTRHNTYLRLLRRAGARMSASTIHAAPEVDGPVLTLAQAPFVHEGEPDLATKIAKINHYSSGLVADKHGVRGLYLRLLLDPPWTWFRSYVLRRQCLNGWAGWINSCTLAFYAFAKYAKVLEARRTRVPPEQYDPYA